MTGGDSMQMSGTLKLEKNNPQQSGKVGRKKRRKSPGIEGVNIYSRVDLVAPVPRGISRIAGESITQTQSTLPKIVRYSHSLSTYPMTSKTFRLNQGTALRVCTRLSTICELQSSDISRALALYERICCKQ